MVLPLIFREPAQCKQSILTKIESEWRSAYQTLIYHQINSLLLIGSNFQMQRRFCAALILLTGKSKPTKISIVYEVMFRFYHFLGYNATVHDNYILVVFSYNVQSQNIKFTLVGLFFFIITQKKIYSLAFFVTVDKRGKRGKIIALSIGVTIFLLLCFIIFRFWKKKQKRSIAIQTPIGKSINFIFLQFCQYNFEIQYVLILLSG